MRVANQYAELGSVDRGKGQAEVVKFCSQEAHILLLGLSSEVLLLRSAARHALVGSTYNRLPAFDQAVRAQALLVRRCFDIDD